MPPLIGLRKTMDRVDQVLESLVVVSSTVLPKIDDKLVGILVLDFAQQCGGTLLELLVTAKVAVERLRIGQIDVPEILIWILLTERRLLHEVDPVDLGNRRSCLKTKRELFPSSSTKV